MSKIFALILSLLAVTTTFVLSGNSVYALESCPGGAPQTYVCIKSSDECSKSPTENYVKRQLNNSDRIAQFYIDVGTNTEFSSFNAVFDCGLKNEIPAIKSNDNSSIYVDLDKSSTRLGTPCEFDTGSHKIIVNALNNAGKVDQCEATYTVVDSDDQCLLQIEPSEGIWSGMETPLQISGDNLTPGGRFMLYFDNEKISEAGFVNTPSFSPITVPKRLMTPGTHKVSLRKYDNGLEGQYATFCPRSVYIGSSLKKAGKVAAPGETIDKCKVDDKDCSKAGGETCDNNTGFKTAIGCIHTTPAGFVKDFLTFAVGIGGGLAFIMMLFGAFQMMTSGGNPQNLQEGKDVLQNAIIGLLFIIFSILLMRIIGIDILSIPGFSL